MAPASGNIVDKEAYQLIEEVCQHGRHTVAVGMATMTCINYFDLAVKVPNAQGAKARALALKTDNVTLLDEFTTSDK